MTQERLHAMSSGLSQKASECIYIAISGKIIIMTTLTIAFLALTIPGSINASSQPESDRMAKGKQVYIKHCAGCHGPEGKGDGYKILGADPANLTSQSIQEKSDTTLLQSIHEGKPMMPAWNIRLSPRDAQDVLAYIRFLAK